MGVNAMKNKTKSIIIVLIVFILISIFIFEVFKFEIISCEIAEINENYIQAKVPYPIEWHLDSDDEVSIANLNGETIPINGLNWGHYSSSRKF